MENAQHQVDWFKNLDAKDLSVEKNTSTASNTSSSSIPIKVAKKQQQKPNSVNVSDNSAQRKPLRSGTTAQQQSRPLATTATAAARKPAVSPSNRSKIPNANVKAKPVTVSQRAFFWLISAPKFYFNKYRLVLHQQQQQQLK